MLDLTLQKKAIYEWAKQELEMEFIWSDQNAHRPNKPYGSMKIIPGFSKIGATDNITHKLDGVFNVAGTREFTLSLNCYGDSALERANFVSSSIEKPTVIEKFSVAGLVVVKVEQVNDLSKLMDNAYETRSQIDIKFRLAQVVEDEIGIIETVELKNNMNGKTTIIAT